MPDAPQGPGSPGPARRGLPEWLDRNVFGLTATQFLGAFNDNLFKTLVLLLFARMDGTDRQALAFGVFALPFILFSGIAGELSEKYSKSRTIVWMKVAEVGVMVCAVLVFWLGDAWTLLGVLFVMGAQSTFFGPSKYAILPEFTKTQHLVPVNGLVVMTTFLAILTGQTLAGPLVDRLGTGLLWLASLACVAVAMIGVWTATRIRPTAAQRPDTPITWNPFAGLWPTFQSLRQRPELLGSVLLYCVFWFDAGVINQSVIGLNVDGCLGLAEDQNWIITVLLLGTTSIAIALGSISASRLGTRIHPGRVVRAGAVLTLVGQTAMLVIGPVVSGPTVVAISVAVACVAVAGVGAGMFSVPLVAFIQRAPLPGQKGRAVAFNNWVNFVAIFLAAPFYGGVIALGLLPTVAAAGAGIVLILALFAFRDTLRKLEFED